MVLEQLDTHMQKKKKKREREGKEKKNWPKHRPCNVQKIKLKWLIHLNIKWKTIILLDDNMGETVGDHGFGDDF